MLDEICVSRLQYQGKLTAGGGSPRQKDASREPTDKSDTARRLMKLRSTRKLQSVSKDRRMALVWASYASCMHTGSLMTKAEYAFSFPKSHSPLSMTRRGASH